MIDFEGEGHSSANQKLADRMKDQICDATGSAMTSQKLLADVRMTSGKLLIDERMTSEKLLMDASLRPTLSVVYATLFFLLFFLPAQLIQSYVVLSSLTDRAYQSTPSTYLLQQVSSDVISTAANNDVISTAQVTCTASHYFVDIIIFLVLLLCRLFDDADIFVVVFDGVVVAAIVADIVFYSCSYCCCSCCCLYGTLALL